MTAPLVSVLIPCWNAERTIAQTLESVLGQSWPNIETIVVDDGSSDSSAAVVERFAARGVGLLRQELNGKAVALNACLTRAKGDFIQYLDADDLISPTKIELQVHRLTAAPDCIASGEWARFHENPSEAEFVPDGVWRDLDPIDWLAESRSDGLGMMFPALWLIPRAIVERAGPWREGLTLGDDTEYFTRALLACRRVLFCAGARSYYRSGHVSLSGRKDRAALVSQWTVLELCEGYVRAREDSERMRRGFALAWQHFAHSSYPYAPDLAEQALQRAASLHPVRIRPHGGPKFHFASRLFGWRLARRLQAAKTSGR